VIRNRSAARELRGQATTGHSVRSGKHIARCYSNRTVNLRIALSLILTVLASLVQVGCRKTEQVTTYSAPKDPQIIHWSVPAGWEATPFNHQLQYAAFSIGSGDDAIKVTVGYLFPDRPGARDLMANVNRWRRQLGLEPASSTELASIVTPMKESNLTMQRVDLAAPSGQRMLAVIVPREDRIWFFKMTGAAAAIEAHKDQFDTFVRSAKYDRPAADVLTATVDASMPTADSAVPDPHATAPGRPTPLLPLPTDPSAAMPAATAAGEPTFTLPPGWSRDPTSRPMRVFTLSTGGEKPAQVIVTRLGGSFGGMSMNFNRWRGEVGLPPSDSEADMKETPIDLGGSPGALIDLLGPGKDNATPMRSMIARRQSGDSVWFFKLLGPAETVTRQQAAFTAFLASLHLPGEAAK
jgi:hypothetical protein